MSIAVVGSILVDKINEIVSYPKSGELAEIESVTRAVGGCVPNVAIDLKTLKPEMSVKAVGKIGADDDGLFVTERLKSKGIDVAGIQSEKNARTSFTEVMSVKGGQRTFFCYAGANARLGYADIDFDALDVKMLHLGYFLLLEKIDNGDGTKILREAKKRGVVTSIDLVSANDGKYEKVLPCLAFTDNLIVNETEAAGLTKSAADSPAGACAAARRLKDLGVRDRVIVHAPEYSLCVSERGTVFLPSYVLPDGFIKGTTGAGDAFCAGSLIAVYEGKSDPEILETATATATAALGEADAVSGMKSMADVKKATANFDRRKLCLST